MARDDAPQTTAQRGRQRQWLVPASALIVAVVLGAVAGGSLIRQNAIDDRTAAIADAQQRVVLDTPVLAGQRLTTAVVDALRLGSSTPMFAGMPHADRAADDYVEVVTLSGDYDQIRLIGLDGRELVKVEPGGSGRGVRVNDVRLTDQSDRPYVETGLSLEPGEVHVSALDLNREFGVLEVPFLPVIRVVTPALDLSGSVVGLVVINVKGDPILDEVATSAATDQGSVRISNSRGWWVRHEDEAREWGKERRRPELTLGIEDPHAWRQFQGSDRGQFWSEDGALMTFRWTDEGALAEEEFARRGQPMAFVAPQPDEALNPWLVVSKVPAETFTTIARNETRQILTLLIPLSLGLIVVGVAGFVARAHQLHGRQEEARLRAQDAARYQLVVENLHEGVVVHDEDGAAIYSSPSVQPILGLTPEQLMGLTPIDPRWEATDTEGNPIPGDQMPAAITLATGREFVDHTLSVRHTDGSRRWLSVTTRVLDDASAGAVLVVFEDITVTYEEDRRQQADERRTRLLLSQIHTPVVAGATRLDDGHIAGVSIDYVNPAVEDQLGYRVADLADGGLSLLRKSERSDVRALFAASAANPGEPQELSMHLTAATGEIRTVDATLVSDPEVNGVHRWVLTLVDVTEETMTRQRLEHQALHDELTRLPNRTYLVNRLEDRLSQRVAESVAVLFCDLDHFKPINDELGHQAGDHVLEEIGRRLQDCVRSTDLAARFGGDEFVVAANGPIPTEVLDRLAARIHHRLTQPIEWENTRVSVGVSVGIAVADTEDSVEELLARADGALYEAKAAGRGVTRWAAPKVPIS